MLHALFDEPLQSIPQPLLDWTITNGFAEVSGQPGVYAAEGVIDGYIDDDGTLASEVVAIVSAAGFYEDAKSSPHAIEQQPPVPAPDPTTIETIAGQTVGANNHVASDQDTPVITGSAPENSLITIYELDPAGSIGAMTVPQGSLAPQAIYSSGQAFADTFNDTALSQTLWRFTDSIEARTQVVNSVVELEPRNTPAWLETTNPLLITGDFSLQFDFQFPDDDPQSSMTLHFGTMARYDTPDMFQIYWGANGEIEMRNTDNVQNRTPYTPPTPGTPHTLQLDYSNSSQTLTLSIDGSIAAVSDPIFSLENSVVSLFFSYQQDSGTNRTAFLDNVNTTMAMPPGYRIAAPALSIDNGPVYDAFGNGAGGFFTNDGQVIFTDGSSMIAGIDGTKDIYAALVTLYGLLYDPQQPPLPQAALTLYTAGSLETANGDQLNAVHDFLERLLTMGAISGYTVDAVGVALSAQPGGGFAPGPMSAQSMVCAYEPGVPASLTWDSAQSIYEGSYTMLLHDGSVYGDFVIWGLTPGQEPIFAANGSETAVPWADGSENVGSILLFDPGSGLKFTFYGTPAMIDYAKTKSAYAAQADNLLLKPDAPAGDYTWNNAALDASGMSLSSQFTCAGYGRTPIATATADNNGSYQATKDAPFAATGDHLLYAESVDPATGRPISNSSIVTYTLEAGQGNPPVIVSIDNQPVANTPEGSDYRASRAGSGRFRLGIR